MTDQYFSDAEIAVFAEDRALWEAIPFKLALLHVWTRDIEMNVPRRVAPSSTEVTLQQLVTVRHTLIRVYSCTREHLSAGPIELEIAIHVRALLMQRFQLKEWPPHPLRWQHNLNKYEYFGIVHMPKELQ